MYFELIIDRGVSTNNKETAFTESKYNDSYGVHEIYINPNREDILKDKSVKMFVKGSDGSYKLVYEDSAKMKSGYIQISDLFVRNNLTTLSNLLVVGDNEVRFEFDGVKDPADVVLTREKGYRVRFNLKK